MVSRVKREKERKKQEIMDAVQKLFAYKGLESKIMNTKLLFLLLFLIFNFLLTLGIYVEDEKQNVEIPSDC